MLPWSSQQRWHFILTCEIARKAPVFPSFSPPLETLSADCLAVFAASSIPSMIFFPMSERPTSSKPYTCVRTNTHTHTMWIYNTTSNQYTYHITRVLWRYIIHSHIVQRPCCKLIFYTVNMWNSHGNMDRACVWKTILVIYLYHNSFKRFTGLNTTCTFLGKKKILKSITPVTTKIQSATFWDNAYYFIIITLPGTTHTSFLNVLC